ncbi:MAG: hypothetical protein K6T56_00330 [Burkholderiales bacterium]|nr:hypothetical protein [Burkholderiales bacterium]
MNRTRMPRAVRLGLLLLGCFAATALAEVVPQEGSPRPSAPRGGFGLSIDLGSLFGAIRDAVKKSETAEETPPLAKQAVQVSPVSGGGYTIDWVVQYANNTNAVQNGVTLVDGPIATILPGSLQQPAGWVGTTNANPPVDNWVKWTGNAPPLSGYMSATLPTAAPASFNPGAGSGDGFMPIPYRRAGVLRIYFINHHIGGALPPNDVNTAKPFGCVDTTTGMPCAGFPKKLPKGDGSGQPSAVNFYPEEYDLQGGLLFYAVTARGAGGVWEYGLGCYDLNLDQECGFYRLGTLAPSYSGEAYVKGPWRIGNRLYLLGGDRRLYCLDAGNPSVFCPGLSSYATGFILPAAAFPLPGPFNYWGPAVFGEVIGGRLYLTTDSNPQSGWSAVGKTLRTFCFDATTQGPCAGFAVVPRNVTAVRTTTFLYYDAAGVARHVCTRLMGMNQSCVDAATGAPSTPPVVMPAFSSNEGFGSEVTVGGRTYFPDYHMGDQSVKCWDWATQAACTPVPSFLAWTAMPKNYAVNVDDQGCIWVLGDNASATWNFDPRKPLANGKAQRCGGPEGVYEQVFLPWRYCSGPRPFAWTQLEIANAALAQFSKLILRVKDAAGNVILTFDALANGSLIAPLAAIDPQTNGQPLRVEVEYALVPGASVTPELRAHYRASPLEFCFRSTHTCGQGPITNTLGITAPVALQAPPVTVQVPLPTACGEGAPAEGTPAGGASSASPAPDTGGGAGGAGPLAGALAGGVAAAILNPQAAGVEPVECPPGIANCRPAQSTPEAPPKRCYWRPKVKAAQPAPAAVKPAHSSAPRKASQGTAAKAASTAGKPARAPVKPKARPKAKPRQPEMEWVCDE